MTLVIIGWFNEAQQENTPKRCSILLASTIPIKSENWNDGKNVNDIGILYNYTKTEPLISENRLGLWRAYIITLYQLYLKLNSRDLRGISEMIRAILSCYINYHGLIWYFKNVKKIQDRKDEKSERKRKERNWCGKKIPEALESKSFRFLKRNEEESKANR